MNTINVIYANMGIDKMVGGNFCDLQTQKDNIVKQYRDINNAFYNPIIIMGELCTSVVDTLQENNYKNFVFQYYGPPQFSNYNKKKLFGISYPSLHNTYETTTIPFMSKIIHNSNLAFFENYIYPNIPSNCFLLLLKHLQIIKSSIGDNTIIIFNVHIRNSNVIYEYSYIYNLLLSLINQYYVTYGCVLIIGDFNTKVRDRQTCYQKFIDIIKTKYTNNRNENCRLNVCNDHFIFLNELKNINLDTFTINKLNINNHHQINLQLSYTKNENKTDTSVVIYPKLPQESEWINFFPNETWNNFTNISIYKPHLNLNIKQDDWRLTNWIIIKDIIKKYNDLPPPPSSKTENLVHNCDGNYGGTNIFKEKLELFSNLFFNYYEIIKKNINDDSNVSEILGYFISVVINKKLFKITPYRVTERKDVDKTINPDGFVYKVKEILNHIIDYKNSSLQNHYNNAFQKFVYLVHLSGNEICTEKTDKGSDILSYIFSHNKISDYSKDVFLGIFTTSLNEFFQFKLSYYTKTAQAKYNKIMEPLRNDEIIGKIIHELVQYFILVINGLFTDDISEEYDNEENINYETELDVSETEPVIPETPITPKSSDSFKNKYYKYKLKYKNYKYN